MSSVRNHTVMSVFYLYFNLGLDNILKTVLSTGVTHQTAMSSVRNDAVMSVFYLYFNLGLDNILKTV